MCDPTHWTLQTGTVGEKWGCDVFNSLVKDITTLWGSIFYVSRKGKTFCFQIYVKPPNWWLRKVFFTNLESSSFQSLQKTLSDALGGKKKTRKTLNRSSQSQWVYCRLCLILEHINV